MTPLPPEPTRGADILVWATAAQATMRRLRLSSGPGIRLTESANGTVISADPPRGAAGAPARRPLEIYAVGPDRVAVTPGTIASVVPVIEGVPITELDEDGLPPTIAVSGFTYLRADATFPDTGSFVGNPPASSVSIIAASSAETPAVSETSCSIVIGYVAWDFGKAAIAFVNTLVSGSLAHVRCGYTEEFEHFFWAI